MNPDDAIPYINAMRPLLERVRTDATALKKQDGNIAWTREPLTRTLMANHLNGGPPRGVSNIKAGESVTMVGLYDLDSHKGETPWPEMAQAAELICQALDARQLIAIPFRSSGGRGIHLYVLWELPQDAYSVRMTLIEALADAGFQSGAKGVKDRQVEVFPKQDEVALDGFGNQFFLPLAGKSVPLDRVFGMEPMARDDILAIQWPLSNPVRPRQRPVIETKQTSDIPLSVITAALNAIPNDFHGEYPDYEAWYKLACAVHDGAGPTLGYQIMYDWSAKNPERFKPKEFKERIWPYIKKRPGGVTVGHLLKVAREEHGFEQPHEADFEADAEEATPEERAEIEQMRARAQADSEGAMLAALVVNSDPVYPIDPFYDPDEEADDPFGLGPDATSSMATSTKMTGNLVATAKAVDPFADSDQPSAISVEQSSPKTAMRELARSKRQAKIATIPGELPSFKRNKQGEIEATILNLIPALRRPDFIDLHLGFDTFRDEIMLDRHGNGQWETFRDEDYTWIRNTLEEKDFKAVGRELIRDTVLAIAVENKFDSAQIWLNGLQHDGKPRCELFLHTHFGAENTPYTRAVSMYLWTALAGRVLTPGCKADMVPIAVGGQGSGKSTGVAAMVPDIEFFSEISFAEKDDDLARKMRGRLLVEIGELRGLHTKELESIKAFITRTHENWIPKFKEFQTSFPRRLVFFGTTNQSQFLADTTGNRRWLPFDVGRVLVDLIKADALQLWAEASHLYLESGVAWRAAESLGSAQHEHHTIEDEWAAKIHDWLESPLDLFYPDLGTKGSQPFKAAQVLTEALEFDIKQVGKREEMRAGNVLTKAGYINDRIWTGKRQERMWVKKPIEETT